MKVAVAVHGRFYAFDLARELLVRDHNVTLFTNYPAWAVKRFGFPPGRVRSFWVHGVLTRLSAMALTRSPFAAKSEILAHEAFGRWTARQLRGERWDVVHLMSGVADEPLREMASRNRTLCIMVRASSHIREQARLLQEEEDRTGTPQQRPSTWMVAREEREYVLADDIVVLSSFARTTFLAQGVPAQKVSMLALGTQVDAFRPAREIVKARRQRVLTGAPLRVLYVGALSFRKGFWDLAHVVRTLAGERFQFRFVGPEVAEVRSVAAELRALPDSARVVTFTAKQPQASLPHVYAWADIFVFPTVEDGYPVVLAQAQAAGLPIVSSTNCSGPDLVQEGETGWVVPIRSPSAFAERLRWCDAHRDRLASMIDRVYSMYRPRDWADVAREFEEHCCERLQNKRVAEGRLPAIPGADRRSR